MNITELDKTYMSMALLLATQSKAIRRKVGCLIVDYSNNIPQIVSDGINGTNVGESNVCEDINTGLTLPDVHHAERNALNKVSFVTDNAVMYVTTKPCSNCTNLICHSSKSFIKPNIKKVYYCFPNDKCNDHDDEQFKKYGIELIQIPFTSLRVANSISLSYINLSGTLRSSGMSDESINQLIINKIKEINHGTN
jgi:deoxycytidylate deaminase